MNNMHPVLKVVLALLAIGVTAAVAIYGINTYRDVQMAQIQTTTEAASKAVPDGAYIAVQVAGSNTIHYFVTDENGWLEMSEAYAYDTYDQKMLADLKTYGGTTLVYIPEGKRAEVNSSAGAFYRGSTQCQLGNPVICGNNIRLMPDTYKATWEAGNDSAGLALQLFVQGQ